MTDTDEIKNHLRGLDLDELEALNEFCDTIDSINELSKEQKADIIKYVIWKI